MTLEAKGPDVMVTVWNDQYELFYHEMAFGKSRYIQLIDLPNKNYGIVRYGSMFVESDLRPYKFRNQEGEFNLEDGQQVNGGDLKFPSVDTVLYTHEKPISVPPHYNQSTQVFRKI